MKKFLYIFLFAFGANLVWENLHARLYLGYKGGQITEWILIRATFWDAVIITALCVLALLLPRRFQNWFVVGGGLVVAIVMERFALATGRWAYGPYMPIVPLLHTGLTPTIQLALIGVVAAKLFL